MLAGRWVLAMTWSMELELRAAIAAALLAPGDCHPMMRSIMICRAARKLDAESLASFRAEAERRFTIAMERYAEIKLAVADGKLDNETSYAALRELFKTATRPPEAPP